MHLLTLYPNILLLFICSGPSVFQSQIHSLHDNKIIDYVSVGIYLIIAEAFHSIKNMISTIIEVQVIPAMYT
jgi:hypothetical protein